MAPVDLADQNISPKAHLTVEIDALWPRGRRKHMPPDGLDLTLPAAGRAETVNAKSTLRIVCSWCGPSTCSDVFPLLNTIIYLLLLRPAHGFFSVLHQSSEVHLHLSIRSALLGFIVVDL